MTWLLLLCVTAFYGVAAIILVLATVGLWLSIEDQLYDRKQRRRRR